jgi:peptidoglycan/LPS O-acetylase OafA/YrhL
MKYYKTLDSLRAFAVFLVILSHWLPFNFVKVFHFGYVGVDIFFVLSGFLITHNLLKEKESTNNDLKTKFVHLKNFIIRRSLRIFPVYYLLIITLAIFAKHTYTNIEHNLVYYLTYTSNILFFNKQNWDGMLSHLWSLAVEEQFYLIWPWLIIFVPRKHILAVIIGSFLLGILSTFVIKAVFPGNEFHDLLTPTCFDAFSLGGMWAYVKVYKTDKVEKFKSTFVKVGVTCFFFFLAREIFQFDPIISNRTFISIIALALIIFAMEYKGTLVHKFILENSFLIFVGKISYGVYLFHSIIPWVWNLALNSLTLHSTFVASIPTSNVEIKILFFFLKLALLLGFCWFSFRFFENPINKFKHRFK